MTLIDTNGAPLSPTFRAKLNVFLRDRTTGQLMTFRLA